MQQLKQSGRVVEWTQQGHKVVDVELHERLPYCSRPLPLRYRAEYDVNGYVVSTDFGDFKVSHQGRLSDALGRGQWKGVATDAQGKVLAEAVAVERTSQDLLVLRETHFADGGGVQFSAKTFIDFDGIKRQETETIGRKIVEYFFYCPLEDPAKPSF